MKLLVLCCLVAAVAAAPSGAPQDVYVVKQNFDPSDPAGHFQYGFEQSDGYQVQAQGVPINEGKEDAAVAFKGSFQYVGADGVTYTVTYVADENGYQPTIEQGPGGAVPAAVVASLLGAG